MKPRQGAKTILIPTQVEDVHALAVSAVLSQWGHHPVRWFGADYPNQQTVTVAIDADSVSVRTAGTAIDLDTRATPVGAVWFRRPCAPSLVDVHPDDQDFVGRENLKFFSSMWWSLDEGTAWINPYAAYRRANSKVAQLMAARKTGFKVPRTLFTNRREDVLALLDACGDGNVVYKPHKIMEWQLDGGGLRIGRAVRIDRHRLPQELSVRSTASIYQELVPVRAEYRVTIMGEHVVAARIDSELEYGIDWRNVPFDAVKIAPVQLPDRVRRACLDVMAELGIVFGCFDLIESKAGDWCFIEVNEMGQFLWKEVANPELAMLDTFARFLLARAGAPMPDARPVAFSEVASSPDYLGQLTRDRELHARRAGVVSLYDSF